ncbi:MAG: hypothetical protein K9W43_08855 [Candidatus Thorarchaeota archaeon]|nr:hypothetical protein [Candidatus Thorarchaeota archaeon]
MSESMLSRTPKDLTFYCHREEEWRLRIDSKLFVRIVLLVLVLLTSSVVTTVVARNTEEVSQPLPLSEYVATCYDPTGTGFGPRPGESSTLESTLEAVRLLVHDTDSTTWTGELRAMLDQIVDAYVSMQVAGRGGFRAMCEGYAGCGAVANIDALE